MKLQNDSVLGVCRKEDVDTEDEYSNYVTLLKIIQQVAIHTKSTNTQHSVTDNVCK